MKITDIKYICVFKYAYEKHVGQVRMNGNKFINHPFRVSRILIEKGFDENCILAGLLHDVREDCKVSDIEIFNFLQTVLPDDGAKLTADVVSLLTKGKGSTPEQTIEKILNCTDEEVKNRAIAVKFADILSNTCETIAHKNTKENMNFKFKWIEKAKRYLNALDSAWDIELQNGIKGNAYKIDIYDALNRLMNSVPKREMSEAALNVAENYICKKIKRVIA